MILLDTHAAVWLVSDQSNLSVDRLVTFGIVPVDIIKPAKRPWKSFAGVFASGQK